MKIVKNLTVANIRKYEGFERREDLDFADDGNYFRGFSYKGMPITTLRTDNTTYLCIRVDYLEDLQFTYKAWMETEEWKLCDEFNGVSEFDIDELIKNLEAVIAKVKEMNAQAKAETVDTTAIEAAVAKEIRVAEEIVDIFKKNFKWYDCPTNKLTALIGYMKSAEKEIESAKAIDFTKMDNRQKREANERLAQYGYVRIRKDSFYLTQLVQAFN